MELSQALGIIHLTAPERARSLSELIPAELIREAFRLTDTVTLRKRKLPHGLNLFAVDGVVWRTPDTRENSEAFSKHGNQHSEGNYPQVRMVCLMELSSHLINASAFDSESVSEMRLAAQLTDRVPDNNITLFGRGYYSLGLLHHWQHAGENRHWLLPLKKNSQYEVVCRLGRGDERVRLKTSPQARKQWPGLPEEVTARLLSRKVDGKERKVLTSLEDPCRYPAGAVSELYRHRWETELGYREDGSEVTRESSG